MKKLLFIFSVIALLSCVKEEENICYDCIQYVQMYDYNEYGDYVQTGAACNKEMFCNENDKNYYLSHAPIKENWTYKRECKVKTNLH